jgi:hypothetical protein
MSRLYSIKDVIINECAPAGGMKMKKDILVLDLHTILTSLFRVFCVTIILMS